MLMKFNQNWINNLNGIFVIYLILTYELWERWFSLDRTLRRWSCSFASGDDCLSGLISLLSYRSCSIIVLSGKGQSQCALQAYWASCRWCWGRDLQGCRERTKTEMGRFQLLEKAMQSWCQDVTLKYCLWPHFGWCMNFIPQRDF